MVKKLERKTDPTRKVNPYIEDALKEKAKQEKQDVEKKNLKVPVDTHARISALASMRGDITLLEIVTAAIEHYVVSQVTDEEKAVFDFLVNKTLDKDN